MFSTLWATLFDLQSMYNIYSLMSNIFVVNVVLPGGGGAAGAVVFGKDVECGQRLPPKTLGTMAIGEWWRDEACQIDLAQTFARMATR